MQRMTDYFARLICIILAAFVLTSPLTAYAEYDAEHPEQREIMTSHQMMEKAGIKPWQNGPFSSLAATEKTPQKTAV